MPKVTKDEISRLKQSGGSAVVGLLVVAGIGLMLGTALILAGSGGHTPDGTVAGNTQQKGGALALPTGRNKGGWIKHDGKYYHYEFAKTVDKQDVILLRTFTLSA